MTAPTLFDTPLPFGGKTYDPQRDGKRLGKQLLAVRDYLMSHGWVTLAEIGKTVHGSEAGVSARIRDLRKPEFGGFTIEREYVANGLHRYRMVQ